MSDDAQAPEPCAIRCVAAWADFIEVQEWRGLRVRIVEQRTASFWLGREGCPWEARDE